MDAATRDEFFNKLSSAMKARKYLAELRHNRPKDTKHKELPSGRRVQNREYTVSEYTQEKPIPCETSAWAIKESKWAKGNPLGDGAAYKTKNGLHEMFHFRILPTMPEGHVAVRRMPCLCHGCMESLSAKWEDDVWDPKLQPMFKRAKGCVLWPVMGDLNDWQVIQLTEKGEGTVCDVEVNQVFEDGLTSIATNHETTIKAGGFGAVNLEDRKSVEHGFYSVVQWTSDPFMLTEPTKLAFCGKPEMEEGTMVATAKVWPRVKKQGTDWLETEWFQPPHDEAPVIWYWLRSVLDGDLELEETTHDYPPPEALKKWNLEKRDDCFRIDDQRLQELRREKAIRDNMVMVDVPGWRKVVKDRQDKKAKEVRKEEVSLEEKAKKRLEGLLNRKEDTRPPPDFTF
jgi:hypothetical protein